MLQNMASSIPVPLTAMSGMRMYARLRFQTKIPSEQDLSLLDFGTFALQTVTLLPCKAMAAVLPERGCFC